MAKQVIRPDNREHWLSLRSKVVTSTEVPALFGLSPYLSVFELWHRKRTQFIESFEPSERMKWGTRLESSIACGIAEDKGWSIRKIEEFMFDDVINLGASFDFEFQEPCPDGSEEDMVGILEIKNVGVDAFAKSWAKDGDNVEAAAHIELQVQTQLYVSGYSKAYIGALVGGNEVVLIERDRDDELVEKIKTKTKAFWNSIQENLPPEPNFERDSKFIASLYKNVEPGKILDAKDNTSVSELARRHLELGEQLRIIEAQRDSVKAQLLMQIGDHEKVIGDNWTITANAVGPTTVSYERQGYRQFRITERKTRA